MPDRTLRPLVAGFCAASLAFVPSWFRILEGTWPAWALAAHSAALALLGVKLTRGKQPASARTVLALALFACVVPPVFLMALRAATGPGMYVHDSAVQTEEAMRYVLEGKNPYVESYASTPMADVPFFGGRNPALEHVVYYPGSFLLGLPVYAPVKALTGWYDHRLFLILCQLLALAAAWRLAGEERRPHLLAAIGLNPAFDFYMAQGANDSLVVGLLLAGLALAARGRLALAAAIVGAACACKQTAWFFGVLLVGEAFGRGSFRRAASVALAAAAVFFALTGPYLAWDRAAFFDDTYAYLAGTARESYPAAGLSVASLAEWMGAPPGLTKRLFALLQLGLVLPLLLWCLYRQARAPGLGALTLRYSAIVAASFVCSRYFNASHLAYVSLFFVAGFFIAGAEENAPGAGSTHGSNRNADHPGTL